MALTGRSQLWVTRNEARRIAANIQAAGVAKASRLEPQPPALARLAIAGQR
jgi:hypothetical protein